MALAILAFFSFEKGRDIMYSFGDLMDFGMLLLTLIAVVVKICK